MKHIFLFVAAAFILTGCAKQDIDVNYSDQAIDSIPEHADEKDPTAITDISEKESKSIATNYVLGLSEYQKWNGRDLKFVSGDKTVCDSCYKLVFTYTADSDKPDFKTDEITVSVNVQGGEVVNYATTSKGMQERPAAERCKRVLTCDDQRSFPIERFDTAANECQRIVYLANPCFSATVKEVVANTPELKKCLENTENRVDTTAVGEYICVFADNSFCSIDTYFEETCAAGKCFRECKNGLKGEGVYSSCTGNLIKPMECEKVTE